MFIIFPPTYVNIESDDPGFFYLFIYFLHLSLHLCIALPRLPGNRLSCAVFTHAPVVQI